MNTRQFTFYVGDTKFGFRGTSVVVSQGVYQVIGFLTKSSRTEILACFPLSSYYTAEIISSDVKAEA